MAFLSGHFDHIVLFNYAVAPEFLAPYLPAHTELDLHDCRYFCSLVGVRCLDLHTHGMPLWPFRNYAQVNLRFYVCRQIDAPHWRHGVVFIKQLIPHRLVAWTARRLFNERTETQRVTALVEATAEGTEQVEYRWPFQGEHCRLKTSFRPQPPCAAPEQQRLFFVERHWGYAAQRDGSTLEYRFDHPPWQVYRPLDMTSSVSVGDFFGPPFTELFRSPPDSILACRGSAVSLARGHRLYDGQCVTYLPMCGTPAFTNKLF